jgi:hypothetical protein
VLQLLSDHPANGTRIQTLEQHFRANPGVFVKFKPTPRLAIRLNLPQNAPMQFLPLPDNAARRSKTRSRLPHPWLDAVMMLQFDAGDFMNIGTIGELPPFAPQLIQHLELFTRRRDARAEASSSISFQLLLYLLMNLVDRLVVCFKMEQLSILGRARNYHLFSGRSTLI